MGAGGRVGVVVAVLHDIRSWDWNTAALGKVDWSCCVEAEAADLVCVLNAVGVLHRKGNAGLRISRQIVARLAGSAGISCWAEGLAFSIIIESRDALSDFIDCCL